MDAQRRIRLGILAAGIGLASLSLPVCGCDSSGGSSAVIVQNKDDLAARENTIKDIYKTKQQAKVAGKKKH